MAATQAQRGAQPPRRLAGDFTDEETTSHEFSPAIEFTANYAFSMSWAQGVYRGHVREEVESLEEVIDGAA
jgi:hypothetical protein